MIRARVTLLAACVGFMPLLQACFPVAAVGVTAGVLAVTDRRSLATQAVDEEVELKAAARIREKFGDNARVNVISYNRKVLLAGEVRTAPMKAEVVDIVRGVPNTDGITDELAVGNTGSLAASSNDAYITSKVKARFIDAGRFSANHVKVVTEAGNVYLLGLVTEREAKDAIEIARTTAGVRKVVNIMETISEAQARALDNRQENQRAPVDDKAAKPNA